MSARALPSVISLKQLKNQAKDLNRALKNSDPKACSRIRASFPKLSKRSDETILRARFGLQDAQLVIAREYGFESWPQLNSALFETLHPEFLTAVRDDDRKRARSLIRDFAEYANLRVSGSCWVLDPEAWQARCQELLDNGYIKKKSYQENLKKTHTCAPLHYCAVNGRSHMAELLLKAGAEVNSRGWDSAENNGDTFPVVLAAWEGDLSTLEVILTHGGDPNADSGAAMDTALRHRAIDKCKLLIKHGATVDLAAAAGLGMTDELNSLLKTETPSDDRAFSMAVRLNQVGAMKILAKADRIGDIEARIDRGMTPLILAAYSGAAKALAYLIELGADINHVKAKSLYRWDVSGTALHVACAKNLAGPKEALGIVKFLVKSGIDTSIRNAEGKTAADLAAQAGLDKLAAAIPEIRDEPPIVSESGHDIWTLIALLGHNKHKKFRPTRAAEIRGMLQKGADPDAGRYAPLTQAAQMGFLDIAEVLLEFGADVAFENKKGQTAIDLVRASRRKEKADMLFFLGDGG